MEKCVMSIRTSNTIGGIAMRKIALRGLLGRRRDTALLWSVVLLAFLFLVLSTVLITSLQETDKVQQLQTYGSWQVLAAGLTGEEADTLAAQAGHALVVPLIPTSGAKFFDGDNEYYLTPYTPELEVMASLELKEGRWPQARNEIVLEYARLASLGLKVGDSFTVLSHAQLPLTETGRETRQAEIDAVVEATRQELLEQFPAVHKDFTTFWYYYYEQGTPYEDVFNLGEDFFQAYDQLTPEQQKTAYAAFVNSAYVASALPQQSKSSPNLLGIEELLLRTSIDQGSLDPLDLAMQYQYTVCGVVETYSDRWDTGSVALPTGFVTQENYELLCSGPAAVAAEYGDYAPVEFDSLVFLTDESRSARAVWEENLPVFNSLLRDRLDFTTPYWMQIETEDGKLNFMEFSDFSMADSEHPTWDSAVSVHGYLLPRNADGCAIPWSADFSDFQPVGTYFYAITGALEQLAEEPAGTVTFTETTGNWRLPPTHTEALDLDGAVVVVSLDDQTWEVPLEDFLTGDFTIDGLSLIPSLGVLEDDLETPRDGSLFRLNRFAYPRAGEGGGQMLMLVLGILFVTTVCAVFQICFTQLRRRMQRIVRMKAIGAENRQIAGMLGWEFVYFWLTAMPVGTVLGLGGAWAATALLSRVQGRDILLTIDPAVFLAALAAGTLALGLGMLVPMVMAVGVPLTGRTVRKKPLPPPRRETRQDFLHVTLRGLWARKGKTIGGAALCVFMTAIALLCLFLGFRFLAPYQESIQRDGKPDYLLQSPYAMSERQLKEHITALEELGVCAEITPYRVGEAIQLDAPGLADSPLAQAMGTPLTVNLYGIDSGDPLFAQYSQAATVGQLDPEAFDRGEQALLLVPLYRATGRSSETALEKAEGWDRVPASGIKTSYYAEYDGVYSRDTALSVGDKLSLSADTTKVYDTHKETTTSSTELTIGAILYYFPDAGIWPVSGTKEGYQLICAPRVIGQLLPGAIRTYSDSEIRAIKGTLGVFYDNEYGITNFYLRARDGQPLEEADTALLVFARSNYMDLDIYHESSEKLLQDAVNNILLTCLLGLTAVLLALVIFANTVASDLEQERRHIGILQALGVSHRRFLLRQLCIGLASSALAVLLANLLLWFAVAAGAAATDTVLANLLWHYPVLAHCLVCLAMAVLLTALYLAPMAQLRSYLPIENIHSRK